MTESTIYLTNWSSRKLHGPGKKYTIMVNPRSWEHGAGSVYALLPLEEDLSDLRSGKIMMEEYRRRYEAGVSGIPEWLGPGVLSADSALSHNRGKTVYLARGDTLCCACSRETAAKGECHRVWAAFFLKEAKWRVILDGKEI
jgi:hypothetical protein